MDKKDFALRKQNYILGGVSVLFILLGFFLMLGSATTLEGGFEPDIFSTKRIVVAPMTCLFGFLLMVVAILYKPKAEARDGAEGEYTKSE